MKKLLSLGFGFVFAAAMLTGFGCALTNYETIFDNDNGYGNPVNTAGNAHVNQSSQIALIYPDGTDNLQWYVDQKANGDQTLSTVNFHRDYPAESPFVDDSYCSPDWSGCKVSVSHSGGDTFDYAANPSCSGYRSLSLLVSTTRYYGECGRAQTGNRATQMLALANGMTPVEVNGKTWLHSNLSALNTSVVLNNRNGSIYALPITSQIGVTANFAKRQVMLDLSNPNTGNLAQNGINWSNAHPGPSIGATLTVDGISRTFDTKLMANASTWKQIHY